MNKDFYWELSQEISIVEHTLMHVIPNYSVVDRYNRGFKQAIRSPMEYCQMVLVGSRLGDKGYRVKNDLVTTLAAAVEIAGLAVDSHHDLPWADLIDEALSDATLMRKEQLLAGDYLLSHAIRLLSNIDAFYLQSVLTTIEEMVETEITRRQERFNFCMTKDVYIHKVGDRRPLFIALSCKMGVRAGGLDIERGQALYDYGLLTGSAYELKKELQDFLTYKWCEQYLLKGIPTLPLLLYFDAKGYTRVQRLEFAERIQSGLFGIGEGLAIVREMKDMDIMYQVKTIIGDLRSAGRSKLQIFSDSPAKDILNISIVN